MANSGHEKGCPAGIAPESSYPVDSERLKSRRTGGTTFLAILPPVTGWKPSLTSGRFSKIYNDTEMPFARDGGSEILMYADSQSRQEPDWGPLDIDSSS
jgi:hypothetical protein